MYNLKKYKEAISCYDKCIEINPNNPKDYFNLGNSYVSLKKYDEAVNAYDRAIQQSKSERGSRTVH